MNEPSSTPPPPSPADPSGREDDPFTAELIEGVRSRDPEALGAFFEASFGIVYGLAFRLLGQRQAAEDITQEVFLRVHRAAGSLDPHRDPRPWLRTVTTNLCRDQWRSFEARIKRQSVSMDDDESGPQPLSSETPEPDAGLLAAEREAHVQEAIMMLPTELREVVILRDFEGLDHQTIAQIVDASHDAVRKRYSRALSQLGELLQDEWP